ncbi:hypothetical protein WMW72_13990 [Paenibacillus filicis]|uniref:DUF3953 domain-containing protein n=1 Tax=Paenibacillus filicis TaxID=669464 RepID=A0ABU9DJH0_9BACL
MKPLLKTIILLTLGLLYIGLGVILVVFDDLTGERHQWLDYGLIVGLLFVQIISIIIQIKRGYGFLIQVIGAVLLFAMYIANISQDSI